MRSDGQLERSLTTEDEDTCGIVNLRRLQVDPAMFSAVTFVLSFNTSPGCVMGKKPCVASDGFPIRNRGKRPE